VICHDAVEVLATGIGDRSLDEILVFFPDPWHKKRHHKRRLIEPGFVATLAEIAARRRAAPRDRLAGLCGADARGLQCEACLVSLAEERPSRRDSSGAAVRHGRRASSGAAMRAGHGPSIGIWPTRDGMSGRADRGSYRGRRRLFEVVAIDDGAPRGPVLAGLREFLERAVGRSGGETRTIRHRQQDLDRQPGTTHGPSGPVNS
jgi:hypothetical protein